MCNVRDEVLGPMLGIEGAQDLRAGCKRWRSGCGCGLRAPGEQRCDECGEE